MKIFDAKDIENDKETVPKIINDLFEISLMPMRPASSPPTSLASIETIDSKMIKADDAAQNKSTDVCNSFIDLLEKSTKNAFLWFVFSKFYLIFFLLVKDFILKEKSKKLNELEPLKTFHNNEEVTSNDDESLSSSSSSSFKENKSKYSINELNELIAVFLKIIDKLFLSKVRIYLS